MRKKASLAHGIAQHSAIALRVDTDGSVARPGPHRKEIKRRAHIKLGPVGKRDQLAKVVDDFGMRSFRIEIEETAS